MAFTRKMLKALGIEEEKIEQIIEAHAETVNALKDERDSYKAEAEKVAEIQKQLDEAKKDVVAKSDYDALKKQYDDYKTAQDAKDARTAKEHAFRELLRSVGVSEKRLNSVMKVSDIDGIELDKDGNIKDADKHTESIKSEWSDFIETTAVRGADTAKPPANNGKGTGKTKDEIMAIKDPATRQAEIAKNPTLFGL